MTADSASATNTTPTVIVSSPGTATTIDPPPKSPRIVWWDTVKGIAIVLIVLGHVLSALEFEGRITFEGSRKFTDTVLLSALTVFYFVSGAFLRGSAAYSFPTFINKKCAALAVPYVLGTLVQGGTESLFSRWVVVDRTWTVLVVTMWYAPYWQFWFLYVLFLASILTWTILRAGCPVWAVAAIAVLMKCTTHRVELLGWPPLDRLFADYVYVAAGVCAGRNFNEWVEGRSRSSLSMVCLAACLAIFLLARMPARENLAPWLGPVGAIAILAAATVIFGKRAGDAIAMVGRHSLAIFALHVLVIGGLKVAATRLTPSLPGAVLLLLRTGGGVLLPLGVALAVSRYRSQGVRLVRLPIVAGDRIQSPR